MTESEVGSGYHSEAEASSYDRGFMDRLGRWVDERPRGLILGGGERNARRIIANAIEADVGDMREGRQFSSDNVLEQCSPIIQKIKEAQKQGMPLVRQARDRVTGEIVISEIRRDGGRWIAEEKKLDGSLISQAVIGHQGEIELTLNYEGDHYKNADANPAIAEEKRFSRGAVKTFELLSKSVLKNPGQIETAEGGSLTIKEKYDLIARTVGQLSAVPSIHIPLLTLEDALRNPSKELKAQLRERWKDVPWKGDVMVRVGHTSLWGDLKRTFALGKSIEGRPNFFLRALGLPTTLYGWASGKLFRTDFYNPLTKTAHVFHPNIAVGMHEMGHAQFFDESRHPGVRALLYSLPIVRIWQEWTASKLAMRQFQDDEERRKATKILEPAYGSYLVADIAQLVFPFVPRKILEATGLGAIGGLAAGHMMSRFYPKKEERFGWVFEGKEKEKKEAGVPSVAAAPA